MEALASYDPDEPLKVIKSEKHDLTPGSKCPTCKQKIERRSPRNEVMRVLTVFKMALGFDKDDRLWDKTYIKRYYGQAVELINFLGTWENACDAIQEIMEGSAAAGYKIFKFQTVIDQAQRWKLDKLERDAKHPVVG